MAAIVLEINEIMSDQNIHGGRPVIVGTTFKVSEVALLHIAGKRLSAPQIAERLHLSLAQAYAALAYYYLHQEEMDEQIRHDTEGTDGK